MNKGGQDKGEKGKGFFQKGKGKGKGPSTFAQSSANPSPVPANISTPTVTPTSTQTSVKGSLGLCGGGGKAHGCRHPSKVTTTTITDSINPLFPAASKSLPAVPIPLLNKYEEFTGSTNQNIGQSAVTEGPPLTQQPTLVQDTPSTKINKVRGIVDDLHKMTRHSATVQQPPMAEYDKAGGSEGSHLFTVNLQSCSLIRFPWPFH